MTNANSGVTAVKSRAQGEGGTAVAVFDPIGDGTPVRSFGLFVRRAKFNDCLIKGVIPHTSIPIHFLRRVACRDNKGKEEDNAPSKPRPALQKDCSHDS